MKSLAGGDFLLRRGLVRAVDDTVDHSSRSAGWLRLLIVFAITVLSGQNLPAQTPPSAPHVSTVNAERKPIEKRLALLGYLLALLLLFGSYYIRWSFFLFPLWVFLMSIQILKEDLLRPRWFSRPR